MKWLLIVIMVSVPGEKKNYFLFDKMQFDNVDQCTTFGKMYWKQLTSLARMKYNGLNWQDMFCLPEINATSEKIERALNETGI